MRMCSRTVVLLAIFLIITTIRAEIAIPPLKTHVTDLTGTLSAHEILQLEHQLATFEKTKGSQIAVLIVPTTQPYTIEQYAMRIVETWKLGRESIDDGVLLLVAKNDRKLRIEVGYGLEGALPDITAKRIIAEIITPHFKQEQFGEGIEAGIKAIISSVKGEALPLPRNAHNNLSISHTNLESLIFILIFSTVIGRILQVFLGRLVGASVTGIGLGFVGWLFFSSLVAAILIAVAVFIFNLFIHINPGIYRNGRGNWSNSSIRSGGSGGGGFSGGGGGSFGGGGASGRW
ncbi:hypothetical protein C7H79_03330 [Nitrosomonas supralitoralis]|uniref:TPM domain-containing protein n=2 Tax=Nitrosomonas supralitoralis TaxID=2116706 RepID=A0A2P7NYC2_9PROT|nr:hypothetical protein C7H79_03330 [Nitrosomonas supralitoralis]